MKKIEKYWSRLYGQPPEGKAPPLLHAQFSEHTTASDVILFFLALGPEPL